MVAVEDAAGFFDVQVVGGGFAPGELGDGFEERADDAVFGRGLGDGDEAGEFAVGLFFDGFRQFGFIEAFFEFGDVGLGALIQAELLLDRLHLLLEIKIALRFVDGGADLVLDFFLEFEDFDAGGELFADALEALGDVGFLQEGLLFLEIAGEVGGEEIGEHAGLIDVVEDADGFVGDVGRELDHALGGLADGLEEEIEFGRERGIYVGKDFDLGAEIRIGADDFKDAVAHEAVGQDVQMHAAAAGRVGRADHLENQGGDAHGIKVGGIGVLDDSFLCVMTPMIFSAVRASSRSRLERGRPMVRGMTEPGKATASRTGRSGRVSGIWMG